jgi:hypothetical protein
MDPRTNNYFPTQHQLISFYKQDGLFKARHELNMYIQFNPGSQLLIAETPVRSQVSPSEICGAKWHWDTFSPSPSLFLCQYHSTNAPHSTFIYMFLLTEGHMGKTWEPLKSGNSG